MTKFVPVLLAALAACTSPFGGGSPDLRVRMERTEYTADPTGVTHDIRFTVTNGGDETVYLPRCGPTVIAAVDKRVGNDWRQVSSGGVCQAIYTGEPAALEPGDSLTSAVGVGDTGRFRVRVRATDRDGQATGEVARSNEFAVKHSPLD